MEGTIVNLLASVIATGLLTGAVSAIGTVAAMKVHISYLRESVQAAHRRISDIEKGLRNG